MTGIDHSAVMLDQAKRRLSEAAPDVPLTLIEGNHLLLGDHPAAFDAIWSVNVVQFFPDMDEAFGLIFSALKPGGRVATTCQPRHRKATRADAVAMGEAESRRRCSARGSSASPPICLAGAGRCRGYPRAPTGLGSGPMQVKCATRAGAVRRRWSSSRRRRPSRSCR
ncbi:MAG: class I SAM-dependent methyltransferase [Brucellaceae bacterium]|nr:class I SAM-dependent methyltransferase [Brucellaceae bacterium]